MLPHIPLLLAGALLVAAPGDDETTPGAPLRPDQALPEQPSPDRGSPLDQLSDAEAFSVVAGTIVGAAAVCNEISQDRVSAAATKVASIVSTAANDENEITSARQLFAENATVGKEAVQSGKADCGLVESSLAQIEQIPQP